jgi:hypothetical protein
VIRQGAGQPKLRYKTHRVVDPQHEVITATMVTSGATDEGAVLEEVLSSHEQNTERKVETAVADSRYGTIENYLLCHEAGIRAHIPSLEGSQQGSGRREDIFPKEAFRYDRKMDRFLCPAGKALRRRHFYKDRKHYEYKAASGVCARCRLRAKCTRSSYGRTLKRHEQQEALDQMLKQSQSLEARQDIKTRQHLSERSFARSTRYGYKRARWRGLWRVRIQDFLVAAIRNIIVLITHAMGNLSKSKSPLTKTIGLFSAFVKKAGVSLHDYWFLLNSMIRLNRRQFGQQPVKA